MNTTDLFVELIVIGVGAIIWLALLLLSIFGISGFPIEALSSPLFILPILAVIYVLGIISDRFADLLFESLWNKKMIEEAFTSHDNYYNKKRAIQTGAEKLSDLLSYGRSRLRICRGWAFNLILINLTSIFYYYRTPLQIDKSVQISASLFLLLFAYCCWYSWKKLMDTEFQKINGHVNFLNK